MDTLRSGTTEALLGGRDKWYNRCVAAELERWTTVVRWDILCTHFFKRLDRSKESFPERKNTMASIYRARRMFLCKVGAVNVWHPITNF